jgi:hypothetical protein
VIGADVKFFLADSDVAWDKLVPIGIFAVIWVVGAIASAVKKASQQTTRITPAPPPANAPTRIALPVARQGQNELANQSAIARKQAALRQKQAALRQKRILTRLDPGAPAIVQQAESLAAIFGPPPAAQRNPPEPAPQIVVSPPVAKLSAIESRTVEAMRVSDARAATSLSGDTPAAAPAGGPRVTSKALAAWLRPPTLRDQFILTEIFQPPLALRRRDHVS